ncbi:MAG: octanoyltransferase LipM [Dehalococcoidia bacterium]|nr:MAG: octanoyltransferase LipM [Dehalococcoidia bacterium]
MSWRLLLDSPADGATNMAIDTAILEAVAAGDAPPTLRLYGWAPPCLSIGALQSVERTLFAPGLPGRDWVRRPTGGRALLHDRELTYAVVAREDDPFVVGGIGPAYRRIAAALAAGLTQISVAGLAVAPTGRRTPRPSGPACYDTASPYELTAGGRKLVGSAQVRRSGALLQHGSIPLSLDRRALAERLAVADREALVAALTREATALDEVLQPPPTWQALCAAIVDAFRAVVGALTPAALTPGERERVAALTAFYRSEGWNYRR